jgi:DNA polymerase-3 subunit gamma/tau
VVLRQMVRTMQVPNALLFTGSRGTGKTTTARVLAAALNASLDGDVDPESAVAQSILDGRSTDVIELDAASNGGVDSVREIRELVQYEPQGWRVVILDEAHSMTREAFNALLKTLEEPPPRTVFVLVTTEPQRIIETVRSRCMEFVFTRLSVADIVARLREVADAEEMQISDELLHHLAGLVQGAMRDALMLLDQCRVVGIETVEAWQEFSGEADVAPKILLACVRGDMAGAFSAVSEALQSTGDVTGLVDAIIATLRDVTLLQADIAITATGQGFIDRQALATMIEPMRLPMAFRVLWGLRSGLRLGSGRREDVELCAAVLSDVLCLQKPQPTPPPHSNVLPCSTSADDEEVTLDDMRSMT